MSTPNNSKIRFNETNVVIDGGNILEEAIEKSFLKKQQCCCSNNNNNNNNNDENSKQCNNSKNNCNCNNSCNGASGAVVQDSCNSNNGCCCNGSSASSSSSSSNHINNQRVREGSKPNGSSSSSSSSNSSNVNNGKELISKESILGSIPKDIMEKVIDWKVKYAFITKGAKLVSTSKQHKFKTPVSLGEAAYFLAESQVKDSTLVFSNDNSLIFSDGVYVDLDLLDESDD